VAEPKSEWTLSTLKELFENKIAALEAKHDAAVELQNVTAAQIAKALEKQAIENERRLSDLNHEAARINAANAANVSREVYDGYRDTNDEWKRRIEAMVSASVPQSEFRSYKDSTSTALTLQAGKREGVGMSASTILSVVLGIGALVGIVIGVPVMLRSSGTPPQPQIIVVPSSPPGSPTTTTTTKP
jgi:hypothetical protein